jgi:hypothetical protein
MPPPQPWEKRYVRSSESSCLEVGLVLKRGGDWIVVLPGLSLATIGLRSGTVSTTNTFRGQVLNVTSMPPLSVRQQRDLKSQADALVSAGADIAPAPHYQVPAVDRRSLLWQGVGALAAWPHHLLKFLRWSFGTRGRVAMLASALFITHEVLDAMGVYATLLTTAAYLWRAVVNVRRNALEKQEEAAEWILYLEEWLTYAQGFMTVKRWAGFALATGIWGYCFFRDYDGASATSSRAPSEGSEAETIPVQPSPTDPCLLEAILDLKESNSAMKAEVSEMRTAQRAAELLRTMQVEEPGPAGALAPAEALQRMEARLATFEETIRSNVEAGGTGGAGSSPPPRSSLLGILDGSPTKSDRTSEKRPLEAKGGDYVADAIKKLKAKSTPPHTFFLAQLEEYEEVDPTFWGSHFPIGYRERVAPALLAEAYQAGGTAEFYGREWLRARELTDCYTARDIVAGLAAIDTMMLVDRQAGLLNKVSVEKTCRKVYALMRAYRDIQTSADWKRPKGGGANTWKTKVNWHEARMIDPGLTEARDVHMPEVDEELRKEMDREASLLKARNKLYDAGGRNDGPPGE